MSLRESYIEFKEQRLDMPYSEKDEEEFLSGEFGVTVGSFCKRIFKELLEIEKRLDELEKLED